MRRLAVLCLLFSPLAAASQEAVLLPPTLETPPPLDPKVLQPTRLWCGGVEFGLNGAEGNSNNFKTRLGAHAKRETKETITKLDVLYTLATQNSIQSENRALANARHEWLWKETPWSVFVAGAAVMDQFTAYDLRLGAHTGVGYDVLRNKTSLFKVRLGAGGSQEFGGPNKVFKWEGLVGADVEHRFSARCKLCGSIDFFPDFRPFGEYRIEQKMSVEVLIDPDLNLTLKAGILDRYDSTPEGRRPNDVEYFAVLLWKF